MLVIYNKYRIRKIIKYLHAFFEDGILNKIQFQSLLSDYTSFLGYIAWFPDRELYASIYNSRFTNFRRRSKYVILIAISLIALGTICGGLSDLFAHHFYTE